MHATTITQIATFFIKAHFSTTEISDTASISMKLINSKETKVELISSDESRVFPITIVDQMFSASIPADTGYFLLSFSDQYTDLYLEPGFELRGSLDYEKFDESLVYEGKGSVENNFMAGSILRDIKHDEEIKEADTEEKFVSMTNAFFENEISVLKQLKGASAHFMKLEEKHQYLKKISTYQSYPIIQQMTKGPTFKVSDSYPDLLKDLNVNDPSLLVIREYLQLVNSKIQKQTAELHKQNSSLDFNILYLDILHSMVTDLFVKNRVIAENADSRLAYTSNKKAVYEKMISMVTDEKVKVKIEEEYRRWEKLEAGNPSPGFSFVDLNNNVVSLKDLKGKFVYIDVWATWCGPCKMEIPHLKKLTEDLKNKEIHFVSICTKDKKENWISMVNSKELEGIQLFAENDEDDFFKSYLINGIPRFILLDKNGKIVDANAKRPSDPELIKILESLL